MAQSIDLAANALVGLTRDTLVALCTSLLRDVGPDSAAHLQNAGYAGGAPLYGAFSTWMQQRGYGAPEALPAIAFADRASEFFRELGWGTMELGALGDAAATIDTPDWAEADAAGGLGFPGCHLTTGMFADFFGRLAGEPLAVMEVECRSMGADRCRFLLASGDVMQTVYDAMGAGESYEAVLLGAGTAG